MPAAAEPTERVLKRRASAQATRKAMSKETRNAARQAWRKRKRERAALQSAQAAGPFAGRDNVSLEDLASAADLALIGGARALPEAGSAHFPHPPQQRACAPTRGYAPCASPAPSPLRGALEGATDQGPSAEQDHTEPLSTVAPCGSCRCCSTCVTQAVRAAVSALQDALGPGRKCATYLGHVEQWERDFNQTAGTLAPFPEVLRKAGQRLPAMPAAIREARDAFKREIADQRLRLTALRRREPGNPEQYIEEVD